jgi:FtsZ-binding cell division protein ZapB
MSDSDDEIPTQSYWPSVTDLFLTLFIISIAIVAVVFCALLPTNNVGKDRALVHAVGNDLRHIREPMNRLRETLGLEPVNTKVQPPEVISALSETCDTAVKQIDDIRSQIEELQDRLSRLMGSKDVQAEMERLLKENEELKRQLQELQQQLTKLVRTFGADPEAIKKIMRENEDLRRQLHDKPPNIQIVDKEGYRFESGSSAMGSDFISALRRNEFARLAGEIIDREAEGRVKVDTLEIIGHTDGAPLSSVGNLDKRLPDVLAGRFKISTLTPGSNNDLGLLRALAVREQWERFIDEHEQRDILRKIHIRCYSAGQTILPYTKDVAVADDFRQPDPRARRIEMRLTRLLDQ